MLTHQFRRLALILVGLAACRSVLAGDLLTVKQTWASTGSTPAETDSVTAAVLPDGNVRVFATSKTGDRIEIFDGNDGKLIENLGTTGRGQLEFSRPNGIVTVRLPSAGRGDATAPSSYLDTFVVVIERDNARIQAIWAHNLKPAGTFGENELTRPYGAAVSYTSEGVFLYVTEDKVPAEERVKVYQLRLVKGKLEGRFVRSFGDAGTGEIRTPESICVDDANKRVYICDEDDRPQGRKPNVKVYSLDGKFTGTTFGDGLIQGDPEGIVILTEGEGGYVILTHQEKALTTWHVFDRKTLKPVTSFTGAPKIANTDGIAILQHTWGPFPAGAFFAVNEDMEVRAYGVDKILALIKTGKSQE